MKKLSLVLAKIALLRFLRPFTNLFRKFFPSKQRMSPIFMVHAGTRGEGTTTFHRHEALELKRAHREEIRQAKISAREKKRMFRNGFTDDDFQWNDTPAAEKSSENAVESHLRKASLDEDQLRYTIKSLMRSIDMHRLKQNFEECAKRHKQLQEVEQKLFEVQLSKALEKSGIPTVEE